jgi:magnesium-transporting ATPase (P-type)
MLTVLRCFIFSPERQRASVIVCLEERNIDSQKSRSSFVAYVKGAPEAISLCCQPSTLPEDFDLVIYFKL